MRYKNYFNLQYLNNDEIQGTGETTMSRIQPKDAFILQF